jgi:hypothetical protein
MARTTIQSGPIQVIPPGLLGLLQIKSPSGENPNLLNNDVQPVLDMLPWWLRANRIVSQVNAGRTLAINSINAFTAFSPNAILVPESEWWYVHSFTVAFDCAGGGSATMMGPALQFNQVGTLRWRTLMPVVAALAAAGGALAMTAEDFWAPPGSQLGFYISEVAGADLQIDMRGLDYTVCRI